jgi:hemerythrin-like domain-containing protein
MSTTLRRDFINAAVPLALAVSPWSQPGCAGALPKEDEDEEMSPTEDLMCEHGVIRRSFLVYEHLARQLNAGAAINLKALEQTAELMRQFGERYHEHSEEVGIFPVMKKAGRLVAMVNTLLDQHQRGREINAYFLAISKSGAPSSQQKQALSQQLLNFSRMYAHHAAREDTILFPALRQVLGLAKLKELGDKFEDDEQRILGKEGFEHGVARIGEIEATLGLAGLAKFTAPPAPKL